MIAHRDADSFETIYQLAYRMALSEEDRAAIVREAYARVASDDAADNGDATLGHAVAVAQEQQRQRPQLTFEQLDTLIRDEPTDPDALHGLRADDHEHLLWELKQGCLGAVVGCLPPGERVAFVLLELLMLPLTRAAEVLDIKPTALRVRASRARNKIVDHLSPRCAHVNPLNPCRCASRLGVALKKGFVGPVQGRRASLRQLAPFHEQRPAHEPLAVYHSLPAGEPPPTLREELDSHYR